MWTPRPLLLWLQQPGQVAEAERLAQQLAGKQAEAELLKSKLEDTMRLAS